MPCAIKSDCSIVNPVLEIAPGQGTFVFNYAYIPDFGRYYFIDDWRYVNGIWQANLSCDVLASYKTPIGEKISYVLRAASGNDGYISDGLYPGTTHIEQRTFVMPNGFDVDNATIVLGVTGKRGIMGGVNYYAIRPLVASYLFEWLMGTPKGSGTDNFTDYVKSIITTIQDDTFLATFDPLQYVKSVMWFPLKLIDDGDALEPIEFGKYTLPTTLLDKTNMIKAKRITTPYITMERELFNGFIKHPQSITGKTYLNMSPFSSRSIIFPPFDAIELDDSINYYISKDVEFSKSLKASIAVDLISGEGAMEAWTYDALGNKQDFVGRTRAQIGVPTAISSATRNLVSNFSGAAFGTLSSLVRGDIKGAIIGGASGILDGMLNSQPHVKSMGSNGTTTPYYTESWTIMNRFQFVVNDFDEDLGSPVCVARKIKLYSGYLMVQDGDVEISGTTAEKQQIATFLTGGFFYE